MCLCVKAKKGEPDNNEEKEEWNERKKKRIQSTTKTLRYEPKKFDFFFFVIIKSHETSFQFNVFSSLWPFLFVLFTLIKTAFFYYHFIFECFSLFLYLILWLPYFEAFTIYAHGAYKDCVPNELEHKRVFIECDITKWYRI